MATKTQITPTGNFRISRDDVTVFETLPDRKLFTLVPDSKVTLENYSFTFANPRRDLWYWYSQGKQSGNVGSNLLYQSGCSSVTALIGEEWGPGRTQDVPDVFLADMPPYTNYLDARVKLTRTKAPDNIMAQAVPTVAAGNWSDLRAGGGATIIEGLPTLFLREIAILLDYPGEATVKAYLRLMTSIRQTEITLASSTTKQGWTVGTSNKGLFGKVEEDKYQEQQNPTIRDDTFSRNGIVPCKKTISGDWSSTYTGTIEITPGRYSVSDDA